MTQDNLFEACEKSKGCKELHTRVEFNWHVHYIPLSVQSYAFNIFLLLFIFQAFSIQDKVIFVSDFHCIWCEKILLHLQHRRSTDPSSHVRSHFLEPFQEIFWVRGCPHTTVPMQRVIKRRTGSRGHARLNSWRWNMCCGISFMMCMLRGDGEFN